ATSPTLAALNNEYYYVIVTDSNGCQGKSPLFHFDLRRLGINSLGNKEFRIYPNPASAKLYIESAGMVHAVISSIEGKKEIDQPDAKEIDISMLANGIYMITLYD